MHVSACLGMWLRVYLFPSCLLFDILNDVLLDVSGNVTEASPCHKIWLTGDSICNVLRCLPDARGHVWTACMCPCGSYMALTDSDSLDHRPRAFAAGQVAGSRWCAWSGGEITGRDARWHCAGLSDRTAMGLCHEGRACCTHVIHNMCGGETAWWWASMCTQGGWSGWWSKLVSEISPLWNIDPDHIKL